MIGLRVFMKLLMLFLLLYVKHVLDTRASSASLSSYSYWHLFLELWRCLILAAEWCLIFSDLKGKSSESFHLCFYLMDDKCLCLALIQPKFPAQLPPDLVPVFFPVAEKCSIEKYNVGKLFFFKLSADIFAPLLSVPTVIILVLSFDE